MGADRIADCTDFEKMGADCHRQKDCTDFSILGLIADGAYFLIADIIERRWQGMGAEGSPCRLNCRLAVGITVGSACGFYPGVHQRDNIILH